MGTCFNTASKSQVSSSPLYLSSFLTLADSSASSLFAQEYLANYFEHTYWSFWKSSIISWVRFVGEVSVSPCPGIAACCLHKYVFILQSQVNYGRYSIGSVAIDVVSANSYLPDYRFHDCCPEAHARPPVSPPKSPHCIHSQIRLW